MVGLCNNSPWPVASLQTIIANMFLQLANLPTIAGLVSLLPFVYAGSNATTVYITQPGPYNSW